MVYKNIYPYRKPKPMVATKVKKAVKKEVKKALNKELEVKQIEAAFTMTPILGAINLQLVNGIAVGADDFQRVGNQIKAKALRIKGDIQFADSVNKVRMLVILDKQPNNAIPALADLFTFTATPLISFKSSDNNARFTFLRDKTYTIGSGGPVGKAIDWYIKCGFKTHYTSNNATIADIRTNALYIAFMTDSGAVPNPILNACYKFEYTDA